jgi:hypothetical protein
MGLALLAHIDAFLRRIAFYCFIGFILGMILIPEGVSRAQSIGDVTDRSITNRLEVWEGALAMTADHPFSGVGVGNFGDQFSALYQPLIMNTSYQAAVNNYLTISAERGVFVFGAYLMLLLVPLWTAIQFNRITQYRTISGITAGLAAYLVCASFTYSLDFFPINLVVSLLWLTLFVYLAMQWRVQQGFLGRRTIPATKTAWAVVLLVLVILGLGQRALKSEPTRIYYFSFDEIGKTESALIVCPQYKPSIGIILYFHDAGESSIETAKKILRPLSQEGFAIISLDYRLRGREGLSDALALEKWESIQPEWKCLPLYLCGTGLGGRIAILAACKSNPKNLRAAVAIDTDLEWPFPDLSPTLQILHLEVPLLIARTGVYSDDYSAQLEKLRTKIKNTPVEHKIEQCSLNAQTGPIAVIKGFLQLRPLSIIK